MFLDAHPHDLRLVGVTRLFCDWERRLSLMFDVDVSVPKKHRCTKPIWRICGITLRRATKLEWEYDTVEHDTPYFLRKQRYTTRSWTTITVKDPTTEDDLRAECEGLGPPSDYVPIPEPLREDPTVSFPPLSQCRQERPGHLIVP